MEEDQTVVGEEDKEEEMGRHMRSARRMPNYSHNLVASIPIHIKEVVEAGCEWTVHRDGIKRATFVGANSDDIICRSVA